MDTFDATQMERMFQALEEREISSAEELEKWILDCSDLAATLSEAESTRYIDMTRHTDNKASAAAYSTWIEEVSPKLKLHRQALDEKYLASKYRRELPADRYAVYDRDIDSDASLFRENNIPLQTEIDLLSQQYSKVSGAMTAYFDGALRTMPQLNRYLDAQDRQLRQFAWEASITRRSADESQLDLLLDNQIALRDRMAKNAGLKSFTEYAFQMYHRLDYSPADCFSFHEAVQKICMPLIAKIHAKRRTKMALDRLRPWDFSVDPLNRPPLRPFETAHELADKAERIIRHVDEGLADQFSVMRENNLLDLESRPGKAPGGYHCALAKRNVSFIFMNASGRQGDLTTILHEAGHAFHANAAREDPILVYRTAPLEFCEVASMAMELLTGPGLSEAYGRPEEHARALRDLYIRYVEILPQIVQIDAFQHWIYAHPGHTHEERNSYWTTLVERFGGDADWSGYESAQKITWQRIQHLWIAPFYFIEYGMAQVGAMQLWAAALNDKAAAVHGYKAALALGGSKPLPELFDAAGLRFDFGEATLAPLISLLEEHLEALPD